MRGIGRASMDRCLDLNQASRAPLPLRRRTARVSDLHVFHAREHPDHIVGIHLAQAELNALQHDVGGAGSDKIDGLAVILPRLIRQRANLPVIWSPSMMKPPPYTSDISVKVT